MPGMGWVLAAVGVIVLTATYVTWTARRVDRLHIRAGAARATLETSLSRRAVAASELAEAAQLPVLLYAARIAQQAPATDREAAENDLTRQLRAVVEVDDPAASLVLGANRRVALARQVHTDVVRDALASRRRMSVRALRLARRHPVPAYFDIDDPALERPTGLRAEPPAQRAAPELSGQLREVTGPLPEVPDAALPTA